MTLLLRHQSITPSNRPSESHSPITSGNRPRKSRHQKNHTCQYIISHSHLVIKLQPITDEYANTLLQDCKTF